MSRRLSEEFYAEMKNLQTRYPDRKALLLPALHRAQKEAGWLSAETLDEVAELIGVHPAQIREVASFYTMFNLRPMGQFHLKVCTNLPCALRGGDEILEYCEKKLKIRCGQSTVDNKFTLSEEECLGACGQAPVLMLNDDYYENLDQAKVDRLIEQLG